MKNLEDYLDKHGFIDNKAYNPVVKKEDWLIQFEKVNERICNKSKNTISLYYSETLKLYALVNDGMSNNRVYVKDMWK
jgi:hypothetical protein